MEQIKLTQTQAPFSASSVVGEFSGCSASAPIVVDERVISDKLLRVRRGHYKGVGRIIKGKRKASNTSNSTVAFGSKQYQVAKDKRRLTERVDDQPCGVEA